MKTFLYTTSLLLSMFLPTALAAQHDHHQHDSTMQQEMLSPVDTMMHNTHHEQKTSSDNAHSSMSMTHAFSRYLPMSRNGSGTSWMPDNSPMYGYMMHRKDWMFMAHGVFYLRYNKQDLFEKGSRGGSKFDAPNMMMLMGQRNVGSRGLFHFNTMISFDPFTVGESGYPLLFQTGETYQGKPLVDRQHPHDLFAELSVSYTHAFSKNTDLFVYLGYPGEPALGPAAFVHRPSAFFNPDAPLSHHWIDATHITYGVATVGLRLGQFKLEGSNFTGREPDENRYDFDKPRFDSWSGRLSFNPSPAWALQVSHGFIKSPEVLHGDEDVNRTTASVGYSSRSAGERFFNATAVWGMNKIAGSDAEHALLLEASRTMNKTTVYGRYEWVQKSAEELNLADDEFDHHDIFPVHSFTLGASYDLLELAKTRLALGAQLSISNPDNRLNDLYGKTPMAGEIYLRIYPARMKM